MDSDGEYSVVWFPMGRSVFGKTYLAHYDTLNAACRMGNPADSKDTLSPREATLKGSIVAATPSSESTSLLRCQSTWHVYMMPANRLCIWGTSSGGRRMSKGGSSG